MPNRNESSKLLGQMTFSEKNPGSISQSFPLDSVIIQKTMSDRGKRVAL